MNPLAFFLALLLSPAYMANQAWCHHIEGRPTASEMQAQQDAYGYPVPTAQVITILKAEGDW